MMRIGLRVCRRQDGWLRAFPANRMDTAEKLPTPPKLVPKIVKTWPPPHVLPLPHDTDAMVGVQARVALDEAVPQTASASNPGQIICLSILK